MSQDVALVLARNPPIELQAAKLRAVYLRRRAAIEEQSRITDNGMKIIRRQENGKLLTKWRNKMREKADTGRGFRNIIMYEGMVRQETWRAKFSGNAALN